MYWHHMHSASMRTHNFVGLCKPPTKTMLQSIRDRIITDEKMNNTRDIDSRRAFNQLVGGLNTTIRVHKTSRDGLRDFMVGLPPSATKHLRVKKPSKNYKEAARNDRVLAQMRTLFLDSWITGCKHDYLASDQHNFLASDHYYVLSEDLDEDTSIMRFIGYATVMDLENGAMIDYCCAPTRELKRRLIRFAEKDAKSRGMPYISLITTKKRSREFAAMGYFSVGNKSIQAQLMDAMRDVSSSLRHLNFRSALSSLKSLRHSKRVGDRTTMVKIL